MVKIFQGEPLFYVALAVSERKKLNRGKDENGSAFVLSKIKSKSVTCPAATLPLAAFVSCHGFGIIFG